MQNKIDEEPFFLVNEFLIDQKKKLESILDAINPIHKKSHEKAVFLKNFSLLLFDAYRKESYRQFVRQKKANESLEKARLEKKKREIMNRMRELQPQK